MNKDEGRTALELADKLVPAAEWQKVLYVGACGATFGSWHGDYFMWWIRERCPKAEFTVVERNMQNCLDISRSNAAAEFGFAVVHQDVRDFVCRELAYDVSIWWHGPEHVEMEDAFFAVNRLVQGSRVVIIGCPHGQDDYSVGDDRHVWPVYPGDVQKMGFDLTVLSRSAKNQVNALIGVRRGLLQV